MKKNYIIPIDFRFSSVPNGANIETNTDLNLLLPYPQERSSCKLGKLRSTVTSRFTSRL